MIFSSLLLAICVQFAVGDYKTTARPTEDHTYGRATPSPTERERDRNNNRNRNRDKPSEPPPPHFLIFSIDELPFVSSEWNASADDPFGTAFDPRFEDATPNIDEWLNSSVVFPRSYAAAPFDTPSRFSLLTGKMATRSVSQVDETLDTPDYRGINSGIYGPSISEEGAKMTDIDGEENIGWVLSHQEWDRDFRYETGMVGKWALMTEDDNGEEIGCAELQYRQDARLYQRCKRMVKDQGFKFVEAFFIDDILNDWNYSKTAEPTTAAPSAEPSTLPSVQPTIQPTINPTANPTMDPTPEMPPFSHNPEWMVSQSEKFLTDAIERKEKPFYLYFANTLANMPDVEVALTQYSFLDTPKGELRSNEIPFSDEEDVTMTPRASIWDMALAKNFSDHSATVQWATLYWIDDTFGALMDIVKKLGVYGQTFIVVQNTHGLTSPGMVYEDGSRILNMMRYPPMLPVEDGEGPFVMPNDFILSNTDIAASFLELSMAQDYLYTPDGISFHMDAKDIIEAAKITTLEPTTEQPTSEPTTEQPTTAAPTDQPTTAAPTRSFAPTVEPSPGPSESPSSSPSTFAPTTSPSTFAPTATPTWLHEDQPEYCCQWRRIDTLNTRSIIGSSHGVQYQYIWRASNRIFGDNATEDEYPHVYEHEQLYNISVDADYQINLINEPDAEDIESALGQLVDEMRNLTRDYVEDVCIAVSGECVLPGTNDTLGTAAPRTPGPTAMPTTAAPTRRNGAVGRNDRNRDQARNGDRKMSVEVSVNEEDGSRISADTLVVLMAGAGVMSLLLVGWQCIGGKKEDVDVQSVSYGACV